MAEKTSARPSTARSGGGGPESTAAPSVDQPGGGRRSMSTQLMLSGGTMVGQYAMAVEVPAVVGMPPAEQRQVDLAEHVAAAAAVIELSGQSLPNSGGKKELYYYS